MAINATAALSIRNLQIKEILILVDNDKKRITEGQLPQKVKDAINDSESLKQMTLKEVYEVTESETKTYELVFDFGGVLKIAKFDAEGKEIKR